MDESVNRNRYDSQEALIREIEADRDALRAELEAMTADRDSEKRWADWYHAELEAAQRRLEVACHIKAEDKVSFDFAVLDELAALREQARQCPPHNWTEWTDTENLKNGFPVCKKCGVIWGCSDNSQDDVINFFRDLEEGEGIRPLPLPPFAPAEGGEG
jgi:hypothetical protein